MTTVTYDPSPTLTKFHASNKFVRGVMGPIGSGKSVGMCWEIYTRGHEQAPGPDGIRKTRWAIIRNTYPELKATTIKTWLDWFPEERFGKIKWDAPITHTLKVNDAEIEVLFMSLDRPEDIKKLLSLELTGCWINEARELPKAVVDAATGRVGRYPGPKEGGCTWSGLIMDTNPPDDTHWWYKLGEEETPEDWAFWRQPGGLSPQAENLNWVNQTATTLKLPFNHPDRIAQGRKYYERIAQGKDEEWKQVYIHGNYGTIIDGKPIYQGQWNDRLHVSEFPLVAIPGIDIVAGWDFGLTPAVILGQLTSRGQLHIIDEIIGDDIGVEQFIDTMVKPYLEAHYRGFNIVHVGDPSGKDRKDTDEQTAFKIARDNGIKIEPAQSNNPSARWESVRYFLTSLRDGQPAFLVSPTCKMIRRGFNGGYRFRRLQVSGGERYSEKADKNEFSHPHDALQYLCMNYKFERPKKRKPVVQTRVVDRTIGL